MPAKLIRVAASPEALLNGVAVSPEGRVFSSFPRWTETQSPSLAEANPAGGFSPFPGGAWNEWRPGMPPEERFVSVHSSSADQENRLWVVDDAAPLHGSRIAGGQKLVCIDLATNRVTRVYPMNDELAPEGSVLGHVRVAGGFAYLTELRLGAIIVIDLASGKARRRLSQHPKTRAAALVPVVEGRELRLAASRQPPQVQVDLVALSPDATWLYFMALFGPMLYRIETRFLRDDRLSDDEIGVRIEDVVPVPPCAGVAADQSGRLYFSSFTQDAILTLAQGGKLETLIADPRISFPNEGAVGPDGFLYFPASQIHRSAAFQADHVSRVKLPFEIFKVQLPAG